MTKTRTWGARAAAVAAAVGLLVGAGGVVNAQPADGVDVAFNIASGGTLSITGLAEGVAIPVPDPNPAQVSGSWSPTTGEFVAFWLRDGRVLAGMNVNVWDVADAIAVIVRDGRPVDRAKLTDPSVPLTEVAGAMAT